jgi:hypothetical protein
MRQNHSRHRKDSSLYQNYAQADSIPSVSNPQEKTVLTDKTDAGCSNRLKPGKKVWTKVFLPVPVLFPVIEDTRHDKNNHDCNDYQVR